MSVPTERFDLVIVGGGIQGATLALEAVRRGLRPALVERGCFGGETSARCLRIVHGGFRQLQQLDLRGKREMARERRFWLRHFPAYVKPLECALPLRGSGIERPALLRAALALDALALPGANRGVSPELRLPRGRVLGAAAARCRLGGALPGPLVGAALWWDAMVADPAGLVAEVARRARAGGAVLFEGVEVQELLRDAGRVAGVEAVRAADGCGLALAAPVVVNAAGPWTGALAERLGHGIPGGLPLALAWNLVLRRRTRARFALALRPARPGARALFVVPSGEVTLVGTGHAPWRGGSDAPHPTHAEIEGFLGDLDAALPGLVRDASDVVRVDVGLVPAVAAGAAEMETRPRVVDHAACGGPAGLWSVAPPKLTTARAIAARLLARIFPAALPAPESDAVPLHAPAPLPDIAKGGLS